MKIILTGGTGFLGSHLLSSLLESGVEVIVLKRSFSNVDRVLHLKGKFKFYDLDKLTSLETVFIENNNINAIIHTACTYGRDNQSLSEIVEINLMFGLQLLELAIYYKVRTFINTDSLLPRSINSYSLSKAQLTDWLKQFSNEIQVINLKVEHMYGPGDDEKKFLPWLLKEMLLSDERIDLTSGIQKRDFVFISDVVSAFILVLNKKNSLPNYIEFDVATNNFVKVKDFVCLVANELERRTEKEITNRLNFGAKPYRKEENMIPVLNNKKLLEIGWKPKVKINQGVNHILQSISIP